MSSELAAQEDAKKNEVVKIAAYNDFRSQIEDLRKQSDSLVFDYTDKKGEKAARSHIYKLRQSKAAVEDVRKKEKAESLEYGRRVDSEAKPLIAEFEAMIAVHQAPIDEIKHIEEDRVAGHKAGILAITEFFVTDQSLSSVELRAALARLELLTPTASYQEFMAEAANEHERAKGFLVGAIARAEEKEAAELKETQFKIGWGIILDWAYTEYGIKDAVAKSEREARESKKAAEVATAKAETLRLEKEKTERDAISKSIEDLLYLTGRKFGSSSVAKTKLSVYGWIENGLITNTDFFKDRESEARALIFSALNNVKSEFDRLKSLEDEEAIRLQEESNKRALEKQAEDLAAEKLKRENDQAVVRAKMGRIADAIMQTPNISVSREDICRILIAVKNGKIEDLEIIF